MLIGTPKYMAPEQAQGKAVVASDIYSLAVLAYRCFTAHFPFDADTVYALIVQHVTTQPLSPLQFSSKISPAFADALLQGLAKDPTQRPPSATAFVDRLYRAWQALPANQPRPATPSVENRVPAARQVCCGASAAPGDHLAAQSHDGRRCIGRWRRR